MTTLKALVVYESMFGNTEQVARAVADGLAEHLDVQLIEVGGQAPAPIFDLLDLVVVGGPTHAFSMSRAGTREDARRWIVEDGQVMRGIALRHQFDGDVGHIGYGIRPSARRRGLATWALGQMLSEARAALQANRVFIPCLANNEASARTIERCGGVLEGVRDTEHGLVRRYWIDL